MDKSVIADAVEASFVLSAQWSEDISAAAEMAMDAEYDFRKACDCIANIFKAIKEAGQLNFASYEVVRKRFEQVAATRARDNQALDPDGAANDRWHDVAKFLREYHGLTKPKAESPDADRMREKRAAEKAEVLAAFAGQSSASLKAEQVEHYKAATPEAIAHAKSLDKAIKLIEKAEKEAIKGSLDALKKGAQEAFKACLATMVDRGDERGLGDLIVLLKRLPDDCAKRDAALQ